MTLEQFETLLTELSLSQLKMVYKHTKYNDIKPYLGYYEEKISKDQYININALYAEWSTGGMSGGNCWNDAEPTYYASDDKPEELTDLDTILTLIRPNMTFLEYRSMTNKLVKHGNRSVSEYYGNSTEYAYTYIIVNELYQYLNDKGWLD